MNSEDFQVCKLCGCIIHNRREAIISHAMKIHKLTGYSDDGVYNTMVRYLRNIE